MSPGQLLEQDTHPAGRSPHVNVARARAGSRALRVQHIRLRVASSLVSPEGAHFRTCAPATLPPHHFSAAIPQYSCSSAAHVVISISPAPTLGRLFSTRAMPFAPNALQVRRHGGLGDRTLIALQLNRHFGQKIVISSSPGTPLHASQRGPGGSETVRGLRNASLSLRMWYGNISAFTSNVVHNLYSRWTMHPPVTRNVSMVAYKHWHSSITHPPDFTNQSKHRSDRDRMEVESRPPLGP